MILLLNLFLNNSSIAKRNNIIKKYLKKLEIKIL